MTKSWPVVIAVQAIACLLVLLMLGPEITSSTRNPEAGLAAMLFGLPLVVGEAIGLGLLYSSREGLPDEHRDMILLASSLAMIVAVLVLLLAM